MFCDGFCLEIGGVTLITLYHYRHTPSLICSEPYTPSIALHNTYVNLQCTQFLMGFFNDVKFILILSEIKKKKVCDRRQKHIGPINKASERSKKIDCNHDLFQSVMTNE